MRIAVIMSTYNGEKYLLEQVHSILNQNKVNVDLYIRDDGSTDSTKDIVEGIVRANKNVFFEFGDNVGFRRSFIECLEHVKSYDYYAFSDQDDFWEPDKLYEAISKIGNTQIPTVYYSNLTIVDKLLNPISVTDLDKRSKSLPSVFTRRSIAGCTMVFNKTMYECITKNNISDDVLRRGHDSFIITLCYSIGGNVICDSNSYIKYRQHEMNASGGAKGSFARIKKEWNVLFNKSGQEPQIAKGIMTVWSNDITSEAKDVLTMVANSKQIQVRLKMLFSSSFVTGNPKLTALGKLKILFGTL